MKRAVRPVPPGSGLRAGVREHGSGGRLDSEARRNDSAEFVRAESGQGGAEAACSAEAEQESAATGFRLRERWLARILAAVLPASEQLPGPGEERWRAFVARFLREAPLRLRLALGASALAFVLSTPLTLKLPVPALFLRPDSLDRHARALAAHRIYWLRMSLLLLKTVAGLCWGADPGVRRALGFKVYAPDPGTWRST